MPQHAIIKLNQLDEGMILTPERYDPRRNRTNKEETTISDIADVISEQIKVNKKNDDNNYLVLDTSDASEGLIRTKKSAVSLDKIKSAKKIIKAGDVIISRLRPYLRQVAFVDTLLQEYGDGSIVVVCSTEFFVLRSSNNKSIAFLVPFLLGEKVQKMLAVSQEGGHHPRFTQTTLQNIGIPKVITKKRKDISGKVESAVKQARLADLQLKSLIQSLPQ